MEDKYPYRVYDRSGKQVLYAPASCRSSKKVEQNQLEHGYTIRLHGRKITKKEVKGCSM